MYSLTKEQLRQLTDPKIKEWFPEVFKVKLEVGKWYKKPNTPFICHVLEIKDKNNIKAYGFDSEGEYSNTNKFDWGTPECLTKATKKEVSEALKNESEKRGFVEGTKYLSAWNNESECTFPKDLFFNKKKNCLASKKGLNDCIFQNGIWATIIPIITKSKAEKLLNKKIID